MNRSTTLLLSCLLLGAPSLARAGDPSYDFKDAPDKAANAAVWKANMQLGLVYVDGNARSIGLSAAALAGVKAGNNEVTLTGGGAYVASAISPFGKGGPVQTINTPTGSFTPSLTATAANWNAKARYDRYFLTSNTGFVSFGASGDQPSGYDYRIEPQIGYARLFFKSTHQLFRGELGYDYTFQQNITGANPNSIDYHSARLLLFYENKFTAYASFTEGLELLEAFNHLEGFRLNSLTSLSSTIHKNVALKVNFKLQFNNDPPSRPSPLVDAADQLQIVGGRYGKVDSQLDIVLAVTFI
jgi:hypothetical protein